jgi:hypothetical protein
VTVTEAALRGATVVGCLPTTNTSCWTPSPARHETVRVTGLVIVHGKNPSAVGRIKLGQQK